MDDSAKTFFQSSLQEALVSSSGMGGDVHSFYVVHPAFPLPTTASHTVVPEWLEPVLPLC